MIDGSRNRVSACRPAVYLFLMDCRYFAPCGNFLARFGSETKSLIYKVLNGLRLFEPEYHLMITSKTPKSRKTRRSWGR
jgi:hypothetical protein